MSNARGPSVHGREHHGGRAPTGPPTREAQVRALAKALVLVSEKHPAWTRHDLLKQLGLVLPPETRQMSPEESQELLLGLAEEALSGRTGDVVCLEAPEWPPLPRSLRRELDGRSEYTRPGVARYATTAQLTMEDTLVAHAQTRGAPRLPGDLAARRMGADPALLEAQLPRPRARTRRAARTAAGPGRRGLARTHLASHLGDHYRPSRHRQNQGPGSHRPGVGRTGIRHRDFPERHQRTPPSRRPGRREHHPAARRHPARVDPARAR